MGLFRSNNPQPIVNSVSSVNGEKSETSAYKQFIPRCCLHLWWYFFAQRTDKAALCWVLILTFLWLLLPLLVLGTVPLSLLVLEDLKIWSYYYLPLSLGKTFLKCVFFIWAMPVRGEGCKGLPGLFGALFPHPNGQFVALWGVRRRMGCALFSSLWQCKKQMKMQCPYGTNTFQKGASLTPTLWPSFWGYFSLQSLPTLVRAPLVSILI